ncbi:MAG: carboxypeptidase-like regulatory domain-containing protein, partial [Haliscomenobacter sp.]
MKKTYLRNLVILVLCIIGACLPPGAYAQTTIKGKVIDKETGALPGVSILVKNTTTGTVTEVDGSFSLNAPDANATLVFSYTGYATQEIALAGRTNLDITMAVDNLLLSEVVVVGYGTQKKETVTGAVSSVKGSDLVKSPAV